MEAPRIPFGVTRLNLEFSPQYKEQISTPSKPFSSGSQSILNGKRQYSVTISIFVERHSQEFMLLTLLAAWAWFCIG
jgi:hypothetical protein